MKTLLTPLQRAADGLLSAVVPRIDAGAVTCEVSSGCLDCRGGNCIVRMCCWSVGKFRPPNAACFLTDYGAC